eukprot:11206348-Lingulodinium_polyedra.AAC.1
MDSEAAIQSPCWRRVCGWAHPRDRGVWFALPGCHGGPRPRFARAGWAPFDPRVSRCLSLDQSRERR